MVRRKKTKTATLILTLICIVISIVCYLLDGYSIEALAIHKGCSVFARLAYSFVHASLPHALINCWCLLSIVFIYDVPFAYIILAYIIAVTYPAHLFDCFIISSPTVGLSAVCFALMGMVSFQTRRKLYFHSWVVSFIIIGYALPHLCSLCGLIVAAPNTVLHIYSYVAGLIVGFLNSPVRHAKG